MLAGAAVAGATIACHSARPATEPARAPGAACAAPVPRDYWPTNGWRASPAAAQGMDSLLLDSAARTIAKRYPNVFGLLVARHGYVVLERYFGGHDSTEAFELRSATKSITSALVGIAIDRHLLRGLDEPIADLIPEPLAGDDVDSRKRRITLRHLLTMTSGLDWEESGALGYFNGQASWASVILGRPMAADPGRRFNYNSGNAHLLSTAVSRASRVSTLEFANRYLFGPLGFTIPVLQWKMDPSGVNAGGSALLLSLRQMAKIGYLYLNDGCWDGKQVVSADWVRQSTRAWSNPGEKNGERYGFMWWLRNVAGHRAFMAIGYGGQYIVVVPDLDLVVAMAADTPPDVATRPGQFVVIPGLIAPAAR